MKKTRKYHDRLARYIAYGVTTTAAITITVAEITNNGATVEIAVATGAVLAATGLGLTWGLTAPPDQRWRRTRYIGYAAATMGTVIAVTPEDTAGVPAAAWAAGAAAATALGAAEAAWRRWGAARNGQAITLTAYRLPGVSSGAQRCGVRFKNPAPDHNVPVAKLTCTCAPGHPGPHVAHCGDLAIAVAIDENRNQSAPRALAERKVPGRKTELAGVTTRDANRRDLNGANDIRNAEEHVWKGNPHTVDADGGGARIEDAAVPPELPVPRGNHHPRPG